MMLLRSMRLKSRIGRQGANISKGIKPKDEATTRRAKRPTATPTPRAHSSPVTSTRRTQHPPSTPSLRAQGKPVGSGAHKGHGWTQMRRKVSIARRNGKRRCKEIGEMLTMIKDMKGNMKSSSRKNEIEKIRRVQSDLKLMVDDVAKEMVSMFDGGEGAANINIPEETRELGSLLDFFKSKLNEANDDVVVEMEEAFLKKKQKLSPLKTSAREVKFVGGKPSRVVIKKMFGKVTSEESSGQNDESDVDVDVMVNDENDVKVNDDKEIKEISFFTHEDNKDFIKNIHPVSNMNVWITRHLARQIQKVSKKGVVVCEREVTTYVDGCTIDANNDIWFTVYNGKIIKRFSQTVSDVITTAPLHPRGVCRSRNGGFLIALSSMDVPGMTSDSYGEVHHIDSTGRMIKKYTNRKGKNDKVFINPSRIAQNLNLDLCVVDMIDQEFTCRLVVLSSKSKVRFIYRGRPELKLKFSSADVSCDHQARIILSDHKNSAVHLLNEDGQFLKFLLTEKSFLRWPRCLSVHGEVLWLGCDFGVVRAYEYKDKN